VLLDDPPMDVDLTRRLFRAMVAARQYDRKATSIQKQGRLATYAPFEGQEAAQIGSAAALRPDDWMVATYRDAAAMWMQGYPWTHLLLTRMGDERGGSPPDGVPVLPPSITVGAHMLHAVGLAWAAPLQGSDRIAITYFGDGATSRADFHEGLNFAGIFKVPAVFVCENNGYAISLPRARQTAAETLAQKAFAYGFEGIQVDGNDIFAVYSAASRAVAKARKGDGPTLIECVTYRIEGHSTSDDDSRYRTKQEVEEWRKKDPVDRLEKYMKKNKILTDEYKQSVTQKTRDMVEKAVEDYEKVPPPEAADFFANTYAQPTEQLKEQMKEL